jgi:uncharacterized protein (DUF4415 family)
MVVGRFYKPIKQRLTIRLDSDVVEWFKRNNLHYQSAINKALREYIRQAGKKDMTQQRMKLN